MGADSALVFYGVRYTVPEDECEPLELNRDPRQQLARRFRLDSWWGQYASEGGQEEYYLFIGARHGSVGLEGQFEVRRSRGALAALAEKVGKKLERAGITQEPSLYVQFCPDY